MGPGAKHVLVCGCVGGAGGRDFRFAAARMPHCSRKQCRMIYCRKGHRLRPTNQPLEASYGSYAVGRVHSPNRWCQKEGPRGQFRSPMCAPSQFTGAKAKLCHQPLGSRPPIYFLPASPIYHSRTVRVSTFFISQKESPVVRVGCVRNQAPHPLRARPRTHSHAC